jgi:hypothetical protein
MTDAARKLKNFINKIRLRINPHPPIVVWQMGKVGSSTVCKSLKSIDLPNLIFQIHFLNPDNLSRVLNRYQQKGIPVPRHIDYGKILLDQYGKTGGRQWKIITIVRDLIAVKISSFFENLNLYINYYGDLTFANGDVNTAVAVKALQDQLSNFDESIDYICTWFDKEIKQMLKLDVFDYPFDHEKGYTIIRGGDKDLLILKAELLNTTFHESISTFLNIDYPFELKNANISEKKYYSAAIKQVRNDLVIPEDTLNKINSSKYMRHFYPVKPERNVMATGIL